MAGAFPDWRVVGLAALYSLGAHGIMTLNDFKSVEGDTQTGINSLPVLLGVDSAAALACWVMALPQRWGHPYHASAIVLLLTAQLVLMQRFVASPRRLAPWYNGTGTTLYVVGMLVSAFALRAGA